jgi:hypothetical protein
LHESQKGTKSKDLTLFTIDSLLIQSSINGDFDQLNADADETKMATLSRSQPAH